MPYEHYHHPHDVTIDLNIVDTKATSDGWTTAPRRHQKSQHAQRESKAAAANCLATSPAVVLTSRLGTPELPGWTSETHLSLANLEVMVGLRRRANSGAYATGFLAPSLTPGWAKDSNVCFQPFDPGSGPACDSGTTQGANMSGKGGSISVEEAGEV